MSAILKPNPARLVTFANLVACAAFAAFAISEPTFAVFPALIAVFAVLIALTESIIDVVLPANCPAALTTALSEVPNTDPTTLPKAPAPPCKLTLPFCKKLPTTFPVVPTYVPALAISSFPVIDPKALRPTPA